MGEGEIVPKPDPKILGTIKGKRGARVTHTSTDETGTPIIKTPLVDSITLPYDEKGRVVNPPLPSSTILEVEGGVEEIPPQPQGRNLDIKA